jgi:cysteine desulfurase/selenocysteine lyase
MEHHSNILPWQRLSKKINAKLEYININSKFELDPEDFKQKVMDLKPKIVSLTYVSNVLGTINPIKEIIQYIRKTLPDTLVIIDAAQAVAHLRIDVKDLDCDFLVFSGHKIYGPLGIGVIFCKSKTSENLEPIILGGGMIEKVTQSDSSFEPAPSKFEAGTPNIAGAIGLATAIKYISGIGIDNVKNKEMEIIKYCMDKLTSIQGLTLFGPLDLKNRSGVFSFTLNKIHPHDLAQFLDQTDICTRAGHHCCQILNKEILKVSATLRVSIGIYNEKIEIDKLIEELIKAKKLFK